MLSHFAVAFVEKDLVFFEDLFELVLQARTNGVRRISLFDPWSLLKSKQDEFVSGLKTFLYDRRSCIVPVLNYESVIEEEKTTTTTDEAEASQFVHLSILDADDGRKALVAACRSLCRNDQAITPEDVEDQLNRRFIFEPDCLLKVGAADTLGLYPPWSLRVTEIISVPRLNFAVSTGARRFEEILARFTNRDRRLGR